MYFQLMAAILHLTATPMSKSIHTTYVELLDPENVGMALEFCCCHVYKLRYTLFHVYFRLQAAIFDLPLTLTSDSMCNSPAVLLDPENMGLGVGISLLS